MLKSEFKQLEIFSNFLKNKDNKDIYNNQKDVIGIYSLFQSLKDELKLLNYFKFIPKKDQDAKIRLAIDMYSLYKYSQLQSYIIGINCLYISLIFIKSRKVFGFKSIFSILAASGLTFIIFRYFYNKIFKVMDYMFREETISLYDKINRNEIGFNPEVSLKK